LHINIQRALASWCVGELRVDQRKQCADICDVAQVTDIRTLYFSCSTPGQDITNTSKTACEWHSTLVTEHTPSTWHSTLVTEHTPSTWYSTLVTQHTPSTWHSTLVTAAHPKQHTPSTWHSTLVTEHTPSTWYSTLVTYPKYMTQHTAAHPKYTWVSIWPFNTMSQTIAIKSLHMQRWTDLPYVQ
jgi:hypothetical protein